MAETPKVTTWTFIIRGGTSFQMSHEKMGPSLDHQGGRTVWKMVGTKGDAQTVKALLMGNLVGAHVEYHNEFEDEEMLEMRLQGES